MNISNFRVDYKQFTNRCEWRYIIENNETKQTRRLHRKIYNKKIRKKKLCSSLVKLDELCNFTVTIRYMKN